MTFKFETIPSGLKARKQWVGWGITGGNSSIDKRPINLNARPLRYGSINKCSDWCTFDNGLKVVGSGLILGLGFVVTESDPFVFIDFDNCVVNGIIDPKVKQAIQDINSYTEYSQSGNGIHIAIQSDFKESKRTPVEVFGSKKYIALTGNVVPNTSHFICEFESIVEYLIDLYGIVAPQPKPEIVRPRVNYNTHKGGAGLSISDDELLLKVLSSPNSKRLLRDVASGRPVNRSNVDMSIACSIARYTEDEAQIERVMRRTLLVRPKWDSKETGNGTHSAYLHSTIEKAILRIKSNP